MPELKGFEPEHGYTVEVKIIDKTNVRQDSGTNLFHAVFIGNDLDQVKNEACAHIGIVMPIHPRQD